jgi:hypothetical protein
MDEAARSGRKRNGAFDGPRKPNWHKIFRRIEIILSGLVNNAEHFQAARSFVRNVPVNLSQL